MNERIAKLYDQAIVVEDGGDFVTGELDPEKFAELIRADEREACAKLRKAAEQALESLESLDCGDTYKTHNAASALRQALSTPEKPDTWVGLTDGERDHFRSLGFVGVLAVEAKLKEKNNA